MKTFSAAENTAKIGGVKRPIESRAHSPPVRTLLEAIRMEMGSAQSCKKVRGGKESGMKRGRRQRPEMRPFLIVTKSEGTILK